MRTLPIALGLVLGAACSEDETAAPAAPSDPPTLTITAIRSVGGPTWQEPGTCLELGQDTAGTVYLLVGPTPEDDPSSLVDWVLRPAGACAVPDCGHLLVRVDPSESGEALLVRSASVAVPIPLATLPAPTGSHTFSVELLDDDGRSLGEGDSAQVSLRVVEPGGCTAGGAAGAGGSAAGAAGAPSAAGQGGIGGA
jgi:hypothetical protein